MDTNLKHIIASIKFPSKTVEFKARLDYDKHVGSETYNAWLIIPALHQYNEHKINATTDEYWIEKISFEENKLILKYPITNEETDENCDLEIFFRRDANLELTRLTAGGWIKCPQCDYGIPINDKVYEIAKNIVLIEVCNCGKRRAKLDDN